MAKKTGEIQIAGISLDPAADKPMYLQLYETFRESILSARLRPGQRLPPTRLFAKELNVSRNTVLLAYDHLWAEGYLKGKTGSGTYVTDTIPEELLQISRPGSREDISPSRKKPRISKRGSLQENIIITISKTLEPIQPFKLGVPALREFPFEIWSRIMSKQLRALPSSSYGYGDPCGYLPLRQAVADYLRMARAVKCEVEQVIIVSGSQQALDITARLLLDPGDSAWIEDPCYQGAKAAFTAAGIRLIPVEVDDEGLNIEFGKKIDPDARLVYVTPSHQFPLGVTMSLGRRLQLIDWANQSDAWIIEDDYDSEYRYTGRPLSSLQGLDVYDRVIYIGTFSKVLIPALRLAYMVVPPDLIDAYVSAKALSDRCNPLLEQATLASFINDGHFSRHIRRMRTLYEERQDVLIKAVEQELDPLLKIQSSPTGMHIVGWLQSDLDDQEIYQKAGKEDIIVLPISSFTINKKERPGLVLGYASFDNKSIHSAVKRFAGILKSS